MSTAAWLFEDHPTGTLAREGQLLATAHARLVAILLKTLKDLI